MKKIHYFTFIFFVLTQISVVAQKKQNAINKIKALKVNYITTELDLSPVEAKKFWPIYNSFEKSRRQIRMKELKKIRVQLNTYDEISSIPENEAKSIHLKHFALEEKLLRNKRKFFDELIEILGIHKVLKLQDIERNFNRKILKEFRRKRSKK